MLYRKAQLSIIDLHPRHFKTTNMGAKLTKQVCAALLVSFSGPMLTKVTPT